MHEKRATDVWMSMQADLRYAFRGFHRPPGFALVAVLSLAPGIGANTAIFSLVNAILLRTLPVRDPSRLVIFTLSSPDRFAGSAISPVLYRRIRDKHSVLEGFALWRVLQSLWPAEAPIG